jgi:hypothetical protein
MESLNFEIIGVEPLLMNNPQAADPFNGYSKVMKEITGKKKKTEDDLLELRKYEAQSKVYLDKEIGIYVPSTWVMASLAGASYNKAKISKAMVRSSVFPTESKLKLNYDGQELVKGVEDISGNPKFVTILLLKQGQNKLPKAAPIFHNWSFQCELEFDSTIINRRDLVGILQYASNYGGFGDFRPTYGRAQFKLID